MYLRFAGGSPLGTSWACNVSGRDDGKLASRDGVGCDACGNDGADGKA
jgi:hypothetical protein